MNRIRARYSAQYVCLYYVFCVLFSSLLIFPQASQAQELGTQKERTLSEPERRWGIKVLALRPTAAGHMLDLRFSVLDPVKAADILSKKKRAFVIDEKSGKALPVPVTKAGPMRQTTLNPKAGRTYFVLFSNPNGLVKEGDKVTVVIGDFRLENVTVESIGIKPGTDKRDLSSLPESERKRWKAIRKALHDEYGVCVEHCGGDSECIEKCRRALASREEREFQQLKFK